MTNETTGNRTRAITWQFPDYFIEAAWDKVLAHAGNPIEIQILQESKPRVLEILNEYYSRMAAVSFKRICPYLKGIMTEEDHDFSPGAVANALKRLQTEYAVAQGLLWLGICPETYIEMSAANQSRWLENNFKWT